MIESFNDLEISRPFSYQRCLFWQLGTWNSRVRSLSGTVYICQSTKCFILIFSTNTICESLFIYRSLCHTVCLKFGFKKAASHNTNYSLPRGLGWCFGRKPMAERDVHTYVCNISTHQIYKNKMNIQIHNLEIIIQLNIPPLKMTGIVISKG